MCILAVILSPESNSGIVPGIFYSNAFYLRYNRGMKVIESIFVVMKILIIISVVLILLGCQRNTEYIQVPTCPYGPPYMTESDYKILSNPDMISDMFADWVVANGEFCEMGAKK